MKSSNMIINKGIVVLALFGFTSTAHAIGLLEATSINNNLSVAGVDSISYDGTGFDIFKPFASVANTSQVLSIGSFSSIGQGSSLDVTLLAEVACFDGEEIPGVSNAFGLVNSKGDFVSVLDSAGKLSGATASIALDSSEEYTLALKSPQSTFSSIDSKNKDKQTHLIGLQVTESGQVVIPNANRAGATFTFNLLAGDLLIFIEDMIAPGTKNFFDGIPADFDYNDMVLVVRQNQTAVPEPSTMLLLASAGLGLGAKRRRLKKSKSQNI
jgi:hypothetical protein